MNYYRKDPPGLEQIHLGLPCGGQGSIPSFPVFFLWEFCLPPRSLKHCWKTAGLKDSHFKPREGNLAECLPVEGNHTKGLLHLEAAGDGKTRNHNGYKDMYLVK